MNWKVGVCLAISIVFVFSSFAFAQDLSSNLMYVKQISPRIDYPFIQSVLIAGDWSFGGVGVLGVGSLCFADGTCLYSSNISINASTPLMSTLPASNISAGTFGTTTGGGNYAFPSNLTVSSFLLVNGVGSNSTFNGDLKVLGNIYGNFYGSFAGNIPFNQITGTISPSQIAAGSIDQSKLAGLLLPAANITSGKFGSAVGDNGTYEFPANLSVQGTMNVSGMDGNTTFAGDVQVIGKIYGGSPVKISGGVNVTGGQGYFGDIIVTSCVGCENFTAINSTIYAINSTVNALAANMAIVRNYTANMIIDSPAFSLFIPINESVITVKGEINGFTGLGALTLTFDGDEQKNYMYKRINGLQWLYQAVTVNPQRNITLEGYENVGGKRTVELTIYTNSSTVYGDYRIASYGGATSMVNVTTGSFTWRNSTQPITSFVLRSSDGSNLLAGSYLIVDTEK